MWLLDDENVQSFYTTMYPIYETDPLLLKFKISISNAIVINGCLYLDYDITYNQYMQNSISISNRF